MGIVFIENLLQTCKGLEFGQSKKKKAETQETAHTPTQQWLCLSDTLFFAFVIYQTFKNVEDVTATAVRPFCSLQPK